MVQEGTVSVGGLVINSSEGTFEGAFSYLGALEGAFTKSRRRYRREGKKKEMSPW